MTRFRQLTIEERYQIQIYNAQGFSQRAIARTLNRAASTISRELARNVDLIGGEYRAELAQVHTNKRRREADKFRITDERIIKIVEWALTEHQWSPEQIVGYLRQQGYKLVSAEWIYQYVLKDKAKGGGLHKHLRHKVGKYRRRYGKQDKRGRIVGRIGIDKRPAIVEKRARFGDWESDTIQGKGLASLVTVVERKTGLTRIRKVARATAELTAKAMIEALSCFVVKTNTSDNGKEFAHHHKVSKALNCQFYFAHPYHSWERGTNENTNGLIRQYFPKGTAFEKVTDEEIQRVEDKLNTRPRKRLGFKSPYEVLTVRNLRAGVAIIS